MREYDLLIGILACQLRLVSRGTLIHFANKFAEAPDTSLLDFLLLSKALTETDQQLLCRIVDTIIHAHHGDGKAALKTFGGDEAASDAFSGSIVQTERGWTPNENRTILADRLPHGLPVQITPETIGRYTRGSEYARGGIGRILLVHDEQIGRDVILKELLPEHAVSPTDSTLSKLPRAESPRSPMRQSASMMARFLQEAKITGQLEHPSIVPVYELGTRKDGQLYYTMKLVRGETLAAAIQNCKTPEDRLALLRSFLDVCQAMAYAHSKGVIHRDLKPSNIMVGEFGECVVLDWGLAKIQKDVDAHREALEKTISQFKLGDEQQAAYKTKSKDVMGTPLYMAPEQARGEVDGVGHQTDVYSLGVVLYEILSGELPHVWSNSLDTIRRVGTLPAPSIRKVAPHTPRELAAICDKALSFQAKDRYKSAKELATDVQGFLEGAVVGAYAYTIVDRLARAYRRHKTLVRAAAGAAAVVAGMGVFSYVQIYKAKIAETEARKVAELNEKEATHQAEVADGERKRAETAEARTSSEKYVSDVRLADAYLRDYKFQSAEDTLLAMDPKHRGFEWSYLVSEGNQDLATLQGHTRDIFALLSPDGSRILTLSGDGTAKLWDATQDQPLFTWDLSDSGISGGAFSPDGSRVAVWMHDGSIRLFDALSGNAGLVWKAHAQRVLQCTFSADGQRIASSGDERVVRLWSIDTPQALWESPLLDGPAYRINFCQQDSKVLACPEGAAALLLDAESGAITKKAGINAPILWMDDGAVVLLDGDQLAILAGADLAEVKRIPAGRGLVQVRYYPTTGELLCGSRDGIITLWNVASNTIKQSFNLMLPLYSCQLDHGGKRVIAASVDGHIRLYNKESGELEQEFGGHHANITTVELAPNDSFLLTGSLDSTAKRWSLAGPTTHAERAEVGPGLFPLAIAADGHSIVLAASGGRITVRSLENNTLLLNALLPVPTAALKADLSADGKQLVTVLDGYLPAVLSMADQSVTAVLHGHGGYISNAHFNSAGTEVVTTSWDNTARIWEARTGAALGTLSGHKDTVQDAAFSPDGTRIATVSRDQTAIVWDRARLTPLITIPHDHYVTGCAFSPDGSLLATSSQGGTIHVVEVPTGKERFRIQEQVFQFAALSFSGDGRRIVAQTNSKNLVVWDSYLGLRLTDLSGAVEQGAAWSRFNGPTDAIFSTAPDGILREYQPLPVDAASPIQDRETLAAALATYRTERARRAPLVKNLVSGDHSDLYLPAPTVSALLAYLQDLNTNRVGASAPWQMTEAVARFYPFQFQAGDTIAAVASLAPTALFNPENEAVLQPLRSGEQPLTIDLLRGEVLTRFHLHGLPVRNTERTVALSPERARALLQAALDTIRGDATTLLEVSRRNAPPGTDPTQGLEIPTPLDADRKALLMEAGLESGTRLVAINGQPVPDLEGLAGMIEAAMGHIEGNATFRLVMSLARGAFESEVITISNSAGT